MAHRRAADGSYSRHHQQGLGHGKADGKFHEP